jgi:hypothetical protein
MVGWRQLNNRLKAPCYHDFRRLKPNLFPRLFPRFAILGLSYWLFCGLSRAIILDYAPWSVVVRFPRTRVRSGLKIRRLALQTLAFELLHLQIPAIGNHVIPPEFIPVHAIQ